MSRLERLSCRQRVALLCDYLDRELPASDKRLIEGHRKSCRSCASLLRSLERTVKTLRAMRREKTPAGPRRSLRAALRKSITR